MYRRAWHFFFIFFIFCLLNEVLQNVFIKLLKTTFPANLLHFFVCFVTVHLGGVFVVVVVSWVGGF